jgi:hypothetical protein
VAPLLRSGWCCRYLLTGIFIDLSGVSRLLAYTWGSSRDLLLSSDRSGSVGVLALLALLIGFSTLRWYIRKDDQDLAI